eukprot:g854.t1
MADHRTTFHLGHVPNIGGGKSPRGRRQAQTFIAKAKVSPREKKIIDATLGENHEDPADNIAEIKLLTSPRDPQSPGSVSTGKVATVTLNMDIDEMSANDIAVWEKELQAQQQKIRAARQNLQMRGAKARTRELEAQRRGIVALQSELREIQAQKDQLLGDVQRYRADVKKSENKELKIKNEIQQLEAEEHIDQVSSLMLQLKEIQDQRDRLERQMEDHEIELKAIHEERDRRERGQADRFEKLLKESYVIGDEIDNVNNWDKELDEMEKLAEQEGRDFDEDEALAELKKQYTAKMLKEAQDRDAANSQSNVSMLDNLKAKMMNRYDAERRKLRKELALRNAERFSILQQEVKLKERKEQLQRLITKGGIDTLVAIELGDAPPTQYILQNLANQSGQQQLDQDSEQRPQEEGPKDGTKDHTMAGDDNKGMVVTQEIDSYLKSISSDLDNLATNLNALRSTHESTKDVLQNLDEKRKQASSQSIAFSNGLEERISSVQAEEREWHASSVMLQKQYDAELLSNCLLFIQDDFIDEVIRQTAISIWYEEKQIRDVAQIQARSILLNIVTPKTMEQRDQTILAQAFQEMQERRNRSIRKGGYLRYRPVKFSMKMQKATIVHRITDVLESDALEGEDEKALKDTKGDAGEDGFDIDEDEEEDEEDEEMIIFEVDDTKPFQGTKDRARLERAYWNNVEFKPVKLMIPSGRYTRAITCICRSSQGYLLAVGTQMGSILVYDLLQRVPQLVAHRVEKQKQLQEPIVHMAFGLDGRSQLVTVNNGGIVAVWSLNPTMDEGSHRYSSSFFKDNPAKLPPRDIVLREVLNFSRFTQKISAPVFAGDDDANKDEKKKDTGFFSSLFGGGGGNEDKKVGAGQLEELQELNDQSRIIPATAEFHFSITLLGHQPSLCIGLQGGGIIKWNFLSEGSKEHRKQGGVLSQQLDRVVFRDILATSEPEEMEPDEEKGNKDELLIGKTLLEKIQFNKGTLAGTLPMLKTKTTPLPNGPSPQKFTREFFQGHRDKVMFIGFICDPVSGSYDAMISVDNGGRIFTWKHNEKSFSGFGWHVPQGKYKINLERVRWKPNQSRKNERTVIFNANNLPEKERAYKGTVAMQEFQTRTDVAPEPYEKIKVKDGGAVFYYKPSVMPSEEEIAENDGNVRFHAIEVSKNGILKRHNQLWFIRSEPREGRLLQVLPSQTGNEFIFVLYFEKTKTKSAEIDIVVLKYTVPGNPRTNAATVNTDGTDDNNYEDDDDDEDENSGRKNRPRLMLSHRRLTLPVRGKGIPHIAVSPVLEQNGTDFLYILMDNEIEVRSLASGQKVMGNLSPLNDVDRVKTLNQVGVFGANEFLIATGIEFEQLYIYSIIDENNLEAQMKYIRDLQEVQGEISEHQSTTVPSNKKDNALFPQLQAHIDHQLAVKENRSNPKQGPRLHEVPYEVVSKAFEFELSSINARKAIKSLVEDVIEKVIMQIPDEPVDDVE